MKQDAKQPHGRVSRFRVAPHDACGVRRGRAASAAGAQVTSGLDASGQTRFPRSVTGLARPTPAVHPRGRGGRGPGHRPADDTSSRPSRARSSGRDLGARPPSPASRLPLPVDSRVTSGAEGYFRFRRRDPSRGSRKGSRKGPRGRPLFQCSEHEVTAFGLASFLWALLLSKGRPWLVGGTATMSDVRAATDQLLNVKLQEGQGSLHGSEGDSRNEPDGLPVTIGATVPTGFEQTAADEVREKLGSSCRISKDRGKIYFGVSVESLAQVHCLRSVDNLFVVVQEFNNYQFKETKEEVLKDFEQLAEKLPWSDPLKVWKMNTSFKKKKTKRKKISQNSSKEKTDNGQGDKVDEKDIKKEATGNVLDSHILDYYENPAIKEEIATLVGDDLASCRDDSDESLKGESSPGVLKFRVTCNRAGEKHCFTSNEAARDFGGSVQDHFKWKADMTNFDVEVLLNIHDSEVIVGIALTEESLHRRNITHFGPTTLRSTLAYGMLRLCAPQPTDIIVDPMCGTGAIPIEGATEWSNCYHLAGDNNPLAVNRAANNISSLLTKNQTKESRLSCGLPIDAIQWDICNLPLRTGSVDIIVTDMPFGKRMGSKKKNWNLYPACLREMSRVCRPGTGRAVLLTQDKKCFAKALSGMGHVWRKVHTVWVNIGGLHAAVYLLKRTPQAFVAPSEQDGDRTPW